MLVVICAARITSAPKITTARAADAGDQHDRIPDGFAEDHDRRARHGDAEERERRHRRRQAERLAERLRSLALRVAREVGNVQAERRPVADVRGQRRREQRPERRAALLQLRRLRRGCGRGRRRCSIAHHKSSAPPPSSSGADQLSSSLMPSRPRMMIATWASQKTANEIQIAAGHGRPRRPRRGQQRLQRQRADPGLDAEPSARDDRAQDRRHVGAFHAERRAAQAPETTRRTSCRRAR